jgi:hypothetical protein
VRAISRKPRVIKMIEKRTKLRTAYLIGIIDSEGSFSISVKKQLTSKWGWYLDPVFSLCLESNGRLVLEALKETLKCGRIIPKPRQEHLGLFIVDNRRQLKEKLIPFLRRYPLVIKKEIFENFAEITEALENKIHSTKEGFVELVKKTFGIKQSKGHRKYSLEEVLESIP